MKIIFWDLKYTEMSIITIAKIESQICDSYE